MNLLIVTATTSYDRAKPCIDSWGSVQKILVSNGPHGQQTIKGVDDVGIQSHEYLGTVPAFRTGVDYALDHTKADVIAALHDDLQILDPDWAAKVLRHFERHPACGLLGFSGAIGLGSDDLYTSNYDPMHLARIGFRSNLVDAEVHGLRSLLSERVAVVDGFSQIGSRKFFEGLRQASGREEDRPWTYMEDLGVRHHCYDAMLGCLAKRYGYEVWYLPISCRHLGGQTAVGDAGYQKWAMDQIPGGDQSFWQSAHKTCHQVFSDVLPIRV